MGNPNWPSGTKHRLNDQLEDGAWKDCPTRDQIMEARAKDTVEQRTPRSATSQ